MSSQDVVEIGRKSQQMSLDPPPIALALCPCRGLARARRSLTAGQSRSYPIRAHSHRPPIALPPQPARAPTDGPTRSHPEPIARSPEPPRALTGTRSHAHRNPIALSPNLRSHSDDPRTAHAFNDLRDQVRVRVRYAMGESALPVGCMCPPFLVVARWATGQPASANGSGREWQWVAVRRNTPGSTRRVVCVRDW